ncbi:MAG: radical SAM protein [Patescibacteria group bacterium]|nr:radical SAM protein [Patescibacteria group bacterium]
MKKNFFFLNKKCVLVKGALCGALYDLKTGNVYSIDRTSLRLLDFCSEEGFSLKEVLDILNNELAKKEALSYLLQLQKMGLGNFSQRKKIKRKIMLFCNKKKLDFLWIELTSSCNLRCLHCYNSSGCRKLESENMELTDWKRTISQARKIGCRKIQFTGGEPLLCRPTLYLLIKYAKKLHYDFIEIFTNGTLLTDSDIECFLKQKVHVAVSFYSVIEKIHESITQECGSYKNTLSNLRKI